MRQRREHEASAGAPEIAHRRRVEGGADCAPEKRAAGRVGQHLEYVAEWGPGDAGELRPADDFPQREEDRDAECAEERLLHVDVSTDRASLPRKPEREGRGAGE